TARGDMEGTGLDRGDALMHQLGATIDQPRLLGAKTHRLARDLVVIGLVGLAEIGGIGEDARALLPHPKQRRARLEGPGGFDADLVPFGQAFQDRRHGSFQSVVMAHRPKRPMPNWLRAYQTSRASARVFGPALSGSRHPRCGDAGTAGA